MVTEALQDGLSPPRPGHMFRSLTKVAHFESDQGEMQCSRVEHCHCYWNITTNTSIWNGRWRKAPKFPQTLILALTMVSIFIKIYIPPFQTWGFPTVVHKTIQTLYKICNRHNMMQKYKLNLLNLIAMWRSYHILRKEPKWSWDYWLTLRLVITSYKNRFTNLR